MDRIEEICKTRKKLIADIREYSHSQKENWQRIPWLALQADGRSGFSEQYAYCYKHGVWLCRTSNANSYGTLFVDCETGDIVGPILGAIKRAADDSSLLPLAAHLDELNTAQIIRHLQKQAAKKKPSWYTQEEVDQHDRWRERKIRELGLSRVYKRRAEAPA